MPSRPMTRDLWEPHSSDNTTWRYVAMRCFVSCTRLQHAGCEVLCSDSRTTVTPQAASQLYPKSKTTAVRGSRPSIEMDQLCPSIAIYRVSRKISSSRHLCAARHVAWHLKEAPRSGVKVYQNRVGYAGDPTRSAYNSVRTVPKALWPGPWN